MVRYNSKVSKSRRISKLQDWFPKFAKIAQKVKKKAKQAGFQSIGDTIRRLSVSPVCGIFWVNCPASNYVGVDFFCMYMVCLLLPHIHFEIHIPLTNLMLTKQLEKQLSN